MNIEGFNEQYCTLRDVDKIEVDALCDCQDHKKLSKIIGKGAAKRNILKHGGKEFICRECDMKFNNPMNKVGQNRQTNEEIEVICNHPEHQGEKTRKIKKSCYYGEMIEPYSQICKSCAQLGKIIPEDQKEKIRLKLTGIKRSDEFKQKLSNYMKNNPEGIARATKNIMDNRGAGFLGKHHSQETKDKMSKIMGGRKYTQEHKDNIADGRKKMLEETGGFTREHRENISKATVEQYKKGFEPNLHHLSGKHQSPKVGEIFYRSSYEKKAYLKLDDDKNVKSYKAESHNVKYLNPIKNIESTYLIDLEVEYIDGTKKLIEIKPAKWLEDKVVQAKIKAGHLYGESINIPFEVWTEFILFGAVYNEKNLRGFADKVRNGEF